MEEECQEACQNLTSETVHSNPASFLGKEEEKTRSQFV